MRNRIFRRYFWSVFLVLIFILFAIDFSFISFWRERGSDHARWGLESTARLLAQETVTDASKWVDGAAARSGNRVAIVDGKGKVVANSTHEANREDTLSVTVPFRSAGPTAWKVRVSGSDSNVNSRMALPWVPLFGLNLLIVAIALGVAFSFMRSFSRRVQRLKTYIDGLPYASMPDGDLPDSDDELGSLAQSLRRTAPKIRDLLAELKVEGTRREAILSSMVEGVLAVDKELKVTFCNRSFANIFGAQTPIPEGMPLLELVRDLSVRDILVSVLQSGEPIEKRIQLRGVKSQSFEVQAAPLASASARGALAILHNVTELERLERVRRDFVANVSHELRTPLAAIRGYAETLLDGALEDQENNRKFVEIILSHAIRLNNIASDLLIISELESGGGGAVTPPKPVSIRAVLESALRTVESSAKVCGVRLVAGRIEDVEVMGYEIRLEQAFVNLLDNAVKFNRPDGEVRVEVVSVSDGKAAILITDTGIGIPSDDVPRIFERFYRVDKARSRAVGGTGLGLSIVRHVIEQAGGSIEVESQLGRGSRFTVVLPCVTPVRLSNVIAS